MFKTVFSTIRTGAGILHLTVSETADRASDIARTAIILSRESHRALWRFFQNASFRGIGMLHITRTEFKDLTRKINERCAVSEKEGRDLVCQVQIEFNQRTSHVKTALNHIFKTFRNLTNTASRDDLHKLRIEIIRLKQALNESRDTIDNLAGITVTESSPDTPPSPLFSAAAPGSETDIHQTRTTETA